MAYFGRFPHSKGNVGTVLISSWNWNYNIYLDIQAISTLLWVLLVLDVWFLLLIHFSIIQQLSWKVTFSGTLKPTPPTVFYLQASDWVHSEEKIGAYNQLSLNNYKLVKTNLQIFKVVNFAKKPRVFQKNFRKFVIH